MKVMAWYSRGVYPLDMIEREGLCSLSFAEEDRSACDRVLLTGISGTGKSTILQGIASAWRAIVAWRSGVEAALPEGEIALLMDGLGDGPVLCICAHTENFWQAVATRHPDASAVGWLGDAPQGRDQADALRPLAGGDSPNVLLVQQEKQLGNGDSLGLSEQLEQLNARSPERAQSLLTALRQLLCGKRIVLENGKPRVQLERGGAHAPEALSSGERRIVGFLTSVADELHPGGVLLLDEPDMHLHPSQVLGLLTTLEQLALPGGGQMILTSHTPEVWRRYNSLGVNVRLEGHA